jgi:hypothetical protein
MYPTALIAIGVAVGVVIFSKDDGLRGAVSTVTAFAVGCAAVVSLVWMCSDIGILFGVMAWLGLMLAAFVTFALVLSARDARQEGRARRRGALVTLYDLIDRKTAGMTWRGLCGVMVLVFVVSLLVLPHIL